MKTLINKTLTGAVAMIASVAFGFAQTRTVEHEYSEFDAVSASDGFKVTYVQDGAYKTSATVDDAIESYVQCYVKSKTLYIELDEKSIPKELKKQYKSKNAADPVLEVTVYAPSLNSITLSDDCVFTASKTLNADKFSVSVADNSSISNLNVVAKSATLSAAKKSKLSSIHVTADDEITVNGDGNGTVILEYSCKKLDVNNAGSAELTVNGQADKIEAATAGSAKLTLSGKTSSLKVTGKGNSSKIDASGLSVETVEASFDAADLTVSPSKTLSLDLGKGATVNYGGDPQIRIVKIQNASVLRSK